MLDLDVGVLWLSKCTYMPGSSIGAHSHCFFHWIYAAGGAAVLSLDGRTRDVQADEFYLIPPEVSHGFAVHETQGLKTIEIKFNVHSEALREKIMGLGERVRLTDPRIRHMSENLIGEGLVKSAYGGDIVNLAFMEILMNLLRLQEREGEPDPGDRAIDLHWAQSAPCPGKPDMKNVLSYMQKNLDRSLSLDDLARYSGLGKFYFNRVFKNEFGVTPIRYLNHLRIAKAKELMSYSDQNITQIAYSVGYADVHYFSRYFKQKEKLSPNEYLKKVRGSLYIYLDGHEQ